MQNAVSPDTHSNARTAASASGVLPVPFVALWSGERKGPMPVVWRRHGPGIGYADERSYDRDANGVLWSRMPSQPGRGEPLLGKVHSLRQRLAMAQSRCQVCGGPADRTDAGMLWLIDAHPGELRPGEEETAHPPVCRPCAIRAVRVCPHLRSGFTAIRVRAFAPAGVTGVIYGPTPTGPQAVNAAPVPFGSPLMPYVRAHQLLMRLTDFHPVDLNDPDA